VVQLDAADAVLQAGGDPQDVAGRIQTSRRLAVDGLREARNAVRELGRDEHLGDGAAVDLADRFEIIVDGPVGRQLKIDFDLLGDPRPVPAAVATAFGAIAREGLTNINKHAPGAPASATLLYGPDTIRLEMINAVRSEEPGRPASPTVEARRPDPPPADPAVRTDLSASGAGLGLAGMVRRMAEVGGSLQAQQVGDRWQLTARWPASAVDHDDQSDAPDDLGSRQAAANPDGSV
jgi:signal transduction histidine kinase